MSGITPSPLAGIAIESESTPIASAVSRLNFVGAVVTDEGGGRATIEITGGGGGTSYTEVATHANLPVTLGTPAVGAIYFVRASTGAWYTFNKKASGLWRRIANDGDLDDWKRVGDLEELTVDSTFALADEADQTKRLQWQLSGVTSGQTRVLTPQDKSYTVADHADVQALQTAKLDASAWAKVAAPASAGATGAVGQWAEDDDYFYLCIATNTWRRTPLAEW